MPNIIETPQSLCRLAEQADAAVGKGLLFPAQLRQIAQSWFEDQQKIKYLESLLVRMGRRP